MLDEQAFLETIFERPEDDGPRLVYADWLDEHGHTDRAEFIRVQIESSKVAPRTAAHRAFAKRERALLAKRRTDWFGEFDGWELNKIFAIRRGFVDGIDAYGQVFLHHMDKHFQRNPIQEVRLEGMKREMAIEVARHPRLARLRKLEMCKAEIDANTLREFLASPHAANLTSLAIGDNEIGSEGAELLSYASPLENLRELNIRHNGVGSEGLLALARNAGLPKLRQLNICGNMHTADDVLALLESPHRGELRSLNLWFTNLRDAGLRKLIACPSLQRITSLNLCNNNFTLNGVIAFFKCGSLEKLEELYLGFSPITVELVHEFLNSPRLPALKLLNLHGCPAIDADQQRAFKRKYKTRVSFQYRR